VKNCAANGCRESRPHCAHAWTWRGLHDSHVHGESKEVQPPPREARITGVPQEIQP
jgi:hypothetical protein